MGISLGMKKVDVTLIKGKPTEEDEIENGITLRYKDYSSSSFLSINKIYGVYRICSTDYSDEIFGLGKYDTFDQMVKKLGEPTQKSINSEGTGMMANYTQYNVSYGINAGEIYMACLTSSPMTFIKEYSE
jgi:hypothetical protein